MDLSDLKVFEAVSRLGSMSRAASELHTVQSNVTARIRVLEEEIGVPLFQRHARGATPTPAGRRILPYVARIAKLVADARSAARDDGEPSGSLLIGSLETTTALRLSPVLVEFAKAYPEVRLAITTGTTGRLLSDVLEYRLDGAFVAGPVSHPDLHHETFFREELVLVTSVSIRSPKQLTAINDLKTIVFQIGCSYRQKLESILAEMGIAVAQPLEFGSLDAIVSCVAAGLGVTLLPRAVVAPALKDGKVAVHKLLPSRAMVETVFVRRHDAYVSSAMKALFDLLRSKSESRRAA
ncbi:LysR family transcriptional regulator [Bradyrhizobium monzae]|uniref:LysR family transcriptional regulator n=1 Tax=Bradyrhizobium sp. Oc8 TaxID=2876780 RepID=UPI001F226BA2|nr:LysR family transcriptional regulator [Bradyrhizobium sp. Oc8]